MIETKTCFSCKRVLPLTSFWKHTQKKDGRMPSCKICVAKASELSGEPEPCTKCKENPRTRSGNWCQPCINEGARKRRVENPGKWYRALTAEQKKKRRARVALYKMVQIGKIVRRPCEVCGSLKSEGHHHNGYEKENRYDVRWLCKEHHGALDRWKRMKLTLGQPCTI